MCLHSSPFNGATLVHGHLFLFLNNPNDRHESTRGSSSADRSPARVASFACANALSKAITPRSAPVRQQPTRRAAVRDRKWPCSTGQGYFGRGAKQLSYHFNYGAPSEAALVRFTLRDPASITTFAWCCARKKSANCALVRRTTAAWDGPVGWAAKKQTAWSPWALNWALKWVVLE